MNGHIGPYSFGSGNTDNATFSPKEHVAIGLDPNKGKFSVGGDVWYPIPQTAGAMSLVGGASLSSDSLSVEAGLGIGRQSFGASVTGYCEVPYSTIGSSVNDFVYDTFSPIFLPMMDYRTFTNDFFDR